MESLIKLAGIILKIGAIADREAPLETKILALYERDLPATSQVEKHQRGTTIKSFFIILVASLFLFTFVGFMVSRRRNNGRLPSNENTQGQQLNSGEVGVEIGQIEPYPPEIPEIEVDIQRRHWLYTLEAKLNFGTRLAIANLLLEFPSAVFDEIASENKPPYVLMVMLLSLTSMLVSLIELVCKGRKAGITWRWRHGSLPWFYYPPPRINRRFGTFTEMIGLGFGVSQFIVTSINYYYCRKDHSTPIKITLCPTLFAFGVVCCRFMTNPNEEEDIGSEQTNTADIALTEASYI